MKSVVQLAFLSLLVVIADATFFNFGKSSDSAKAKGSSLTAKNGRKVILVAKKVYVPMYASDDALSSVTDERLLPINPALLATSGTNGRQEQQMVAYPPMSSMYLQPPAASYAMYAPAASVPVAAESGVPQQYAFYPAGYGAVDPQEYVQIGVAPSQAMVYGTGDVAAAAAAYYPTAVDQGSIVDGSAVPSKETNV